MACFHFRISIAAHGDVRLLVANIKDITMPASTFPEKGTEKEKCRNSKMQKKESLNRK